MLIEVFAAASIGGMVGFFACAALTAGKVADGTTLQALLDDAREAADRASDAAGAMQARIERALDCVTENSAHVGKKMAAILKGERL